MSKIDLIRARHQRWPKIVDKSSSVVSRHVAEMFHDDIAYLLKVITARDAEMGAAEFTVSNGGKNPAAVALGRLGGLKGGKARAYWMTPEERSEAARKAALARWKTDKEEQDG